MRNDEQHPLIGPDGTAGSRSGSTSGVVPSEAIGRRPSAACSTSDAIITKHCERSLPGRIEPIRSMKIIADTTAAVGRPVFIRAIGPERISRASVARWQYGDTQLRLDTSDAVRVILSLRGGHVVRHGAGSSRRVGAGSVYVFAAETPTDLEIEGKTDVVQIFIDPSCIDEVTGGDDTGVLSFDNHDPALRAATLQLFVAAHSQDPDNDLLMESALWRLVEYFVRRTPAYRRERWIGGLAHNAMRRVEELISAWLATAETAPSIVELAASAGLSVHHFIRAFKRSTGNTPHQYVMARRLERSMDLLRGSKGSVAAVACSLGYASSSHFVASFRRTMGVTPGAFRTAVAAHSLRT
jgi:AraC family transcriptional regulator